MKSFETLLRAALVACVLPAAACSLLVDGALVEPPVMMGSACDGLDDGTPCMREGISAALICVRNVCTNSRCGDGVLDRRARVDGTFEDCDDGNPIDGDGCESDCSITARCTSELDCAFPGIECLTATCDLGSGECGVTASPDETPCNTESMGAGTCSSGVCIAAGCGNGTREVGEDCDDGNSDYGDGCAPDCRPECTETSQCSQDPCFGIEECVTSSDPTIGMLGVCEVREPGIVCANPACEYCDSELRSCVPTPEADFDGDGYPSLACGGTDCDDEKFDVNPGRTEECDLAMADLNCVEGDEPAMTEWFSDCDGDGFPPADAVTMVTCEPPTVASDRCLLGSGSWTSRRPVSGALDCQDENPDVYPTQTRYFDTSYRTTAGGNSFDYNCSGREDSQYADAASPDTVTCNGGTLGCDTRPPSPLFPQRINCGASATLYSCVDVRIACRRTPSDAPVVKRCR